MINTFCYDYILNKYLLLQNLNEKEHNKKVKNFGYNISYKYTLLQSSKITPDQTNNKTNLYNFLFKKIYGEIFSNDGLEINHINDNFILLKDRNNRILRDLESFLIKDPIRKKLIEIYFEGVIEGLCNCFKLKINSNCEIFFDKQEIIIKLEF